MAGSSTSVRKSTRLDIEFNFMKNSFEGRPNAEVLEKQTAKNTIEALRAAKNSRPDEFRGIIELRKNLFANGNQEHEQRVKLAQVILGYISPEILKAHDVQIGSTDGGGETVLEEYNDVERLNKAFEEAVKKNF